MCRLPFFVTPGAAVTGSAWRETIGADGRMAVACVRGVVCGRTGAVDADEVAVGRRDAPDPVDAVQARRRARAPRPATRVWTAKLTPRASTNCWSWVRKSAAKAVATMFPFPPSSEVPPSTTAATDGEQVSVALEGGRVDDDAGEQHGAEPVEDLGPYVGRDAVPVDLQAGRPAGARGWPRRLRSGGRPQWT